MTMTASPDSDERAVSELYFAVTNWALSQGAVDLSKKPGLWRGKTQKIGPLGPLDVRINPHKQAIDKVPPYHVLITMDDYFPGLIALLNPYGGTIMHSRAPGEDEAGLIAHFETQTPKELP
jgi:hypothetical protein